MTVKIEMDMPKSCAECRFNLDDNRMGVNYCAITLEETDCYRVTRTQECPLQEVKECK